MTDFPWLTTLAAVPLVGAVVVAALPAGRDLLAKQVALAISLVAARHDHRDGAAVRRRQQGDVPVRRDPRVDPAVRRQLRASASTASRWC